MASSFGELFRITTWGESHGGGVGVVIDGCPPRLELSEEDIQRELDRRRPGQSAIVTPRDESDRCQILSGVFEGRTLGTPISILVMNKDARPEAYSEIKATYRPSHADFTYEAKYGIRNWQGGGRASARETVGRVAAGAVARKVLNKISASRLRSSLVIRIHEISARGSAIGDDGSCRSHSVRCPDADAARQDGTVESSRTRRFWRLIDCVIRGTEGASRAVFTNGRPILPGDADLAGLEVFETLRLRSRGMRGSHHNDAFGCAMEKSGNHAQLRWGAGCISNGEDIFFRRFQPTSTIARVRKR